MRDPFTVLGVAEDAGDAAYDALSDERKRLETKLLHTNEAALSRLNSAALRVASSASGRPSKQTVGALLNEGIMRTLTD